MSLEEEIYKLQEAREKALRAKDQLIEAQSEKITALKKQREEYVREREKGIKLLEGLNAAKSDAIERLQSKIGDLEYIIAKQDEMIANFESDVGRRSPKSSFQNNNSTHIDEALKVLQEAYGGDESRDSFVPRPSSTQDRRPLNRSISRESPNKEKSQVERHMETNSKIADLFEQVHVENSQHFQSLNERYERVQKEMNDLKSTYNNEIEREKSTISVLIQENKDLKQLVSSLMVQLKEKTSEVPLKELDKDEQYERLRYKYRDLKYRYSNLKERLRIALADQKFIEEPTKNPIKQPRKSPTRVRASNELGNYYIQNELPRRPPLEHHNPSSNPGFPSTKPPELLKRQEQGANIEDKIYSFDRESIEDAKKHLFEHYLAKTSPQKPIFMPTASPALVSPVKNILHADPAPKIEVEKKKNVQKAKHVTRVWK